MTFPLPTFPVPILTAFMTLDATPALSMSAPITTRERLRSHRFADGGARKGGGSIRMQERY